MRDGPRNLGGARGLPGPMSQTSLLDPDYCLQRAAEVRKLAAEFADEKLRLILLQMAESYEAMAALLRRE